MKTNKLIEMVRDGIFKKRIVLRDESILYVQDPTIKNEILSALIRGETHITATNPPTSDMATETLCAFDDGGDWNFKKWYEIADSPSTYVIWVVLPNVYTQHNTEERP